QPLSHPFPYTALFRSHPSGWPCPCPDGRSATGRILVQGADDRAHGHQRIALEVQLGDQTGGNGRTTDGKVDVRRTPVIGTIAPGDRKSTRLNSSHVKI